MLRKVNLWDTVSKSPKIQTPTLSLCLWAGGLQALFKIQQKATEKLKILKTVR